MWPFKKKQTQGADAGEAIFNGFTDWHCHILPGVDDGVQTMEESLAVLEQYEAWGVKCVWLTPHIMEDMPNTTAALRERFEELRQAYTGSVELHLAAENMMDNLFKERLESKDVLPIGPRGDHLLVETSYFSPPMDLYDILERVKSKGYYPILAHPERYVYMEKRNYERLHSMGVKFQLNLFSQTGRYGRDVIKKMNSLLEKHYYTYVGTDLHRKSMLADVPKLKLRPL